MKRTPFLPHNSASSGAISNKPPTTSNNDDGSRLDQQALGMRPCSFEGFSAGCGGQPVTHEFLGRLYPSALLDDVLTPHREGQGDGGDVPLGRNDSSRMGALGNSQVLSALDATAQYRCVLGSAR